MGNTDLTTRKKTESFIIDESFRCYSADAMRWWSAPHGNCLFSNPTMSEIWMFEVVYPVFYVDSLLIYIQRVNNFIHMVYIFPAVLVVLRGLHKKLYDFRTYYLAVWQAIFVFLLYLQIAHIIWFSLTVDKSRSYTDVGVFL